MSAARPRRVGLRRRLPKVSPRTRRLLLRLLVAVIAIVGWEIFVRVGGSFGTPSLLRILRAVVVLPSQGEFWVAIWTTVQSLLIGYPIAALIGVPLDVLVGRVPSLERVAMVHLTILLSVPLSAVVPIVVIVFGIGVSARVAVVVLFSLPMIAVNTVTGVATVDRSLLEMGQSYGCDRPHLIRKIVLPGAMPEILSGLRLGAGRAVIGMIVAELIIIAVGVGRLMDRYAGQFKMPEVYALVISILVISAVFVNAVRFVERRMLRWRDG